jgi:hypothetical protein
MIYYRGCPNMYARHYALELLRLNKSKSKAIALAEEGLMRARDFNEQCYWNKVIREFNILDLYENNIDNVKWIDLYNVYTKSCRDK